MFHVNNLDVRQSRQANDSGSIVKRAKERLRNSEMLKKAQQEAKQERHTSPPLTWKKKSKPPWKAAMVPSAPT